MKQINKLTILAANTKVSGEMSAEGDVRVDGVFEGNITASKKLITGEKSSLYGDISANEIIITNRFKGELAAKSISLEERAYVMGTIYSEKLKISPEAFFEGESKRLNGRKVPLIKDENKEKKKATLNMNNIEPEEKEKRLNKEVKENKKGFFNLRCKNKYLSCDQEID